MKTEGIILDTHFSQEVICTKTRRKDKNYQSRPGTKKEKRKRKSGKRQANDQDMQKKFNPPKQDPRKSSRS
jgi:hypothetical protein